MNSSQTLKYDISRTDIFWREKEGEKKDMQEGWGESPSLLICHLNPSNFFHFRKTHPLLPASRCYSPSPPDCSVCRSACSMFLLLSNGGRLLHCTEFLTLPWVIVACTTSAQYNFLRALQNAMYLISDSHLG